MATAPVRGKLQALPSLDARSPYPMNQEHLGHALVMNNLRSKFPRTAVDAEAIASALDSVGFTVTQYNDCDVEEMRIIKDNVTTESLHVTTNCLFVVFLCHKIEQGWLLDRYHRRAYSIEQFTTSLSKVRTLKGKPKVLLIQEAKNGSEDDGEEIPIQRDKKDFYIVCATCDSESESRLSYLQEFAKNLEDNHMKEPLSTILLMTKESLQTPVQIPPALQNKELMTLAGKISTEAMEIIAIEKLDIEYDLVKSLSEANREKHQMMKFELLRKWKNMNQGVTRQKLAAILRDTDGRVDSKMVDKVLQTGQMEEQGVRHFDSFVHALYISEFYEKSAVSEGAESEDPEIHPAIESRLQELQERVAELNREKMAQEASKSSQSEFISQLGKQLQIQEQKLREMEAKQKEETQQEIPPHVASRLQQLQETIQELKREKARQEASRSETEQKLKEQEKTLRKLDKRGKGEISEPPQKEIISDMEKKLKQQEEKLKELEMKTRQQTRRPVTLTRISSHDTNLEDWYNGGFTVMPSTGRIVIDGKAKKLIGEAKWYLHIYTPTGKNLKHTTKKSPCENSFNLLGVEVAGQELLAVSCDECKDIQLLDLHTQQVTTAFKGRVKRMCHGDTNRLYVELYERGEVMELNTSSSTFSLVKTINTGMDGFAGMCYVPTPHRHLVVSNITFIEGKISDGIICAMSCETGQRVFHVSGKVDGREIHPCGLLFSPQHGSVLVADGDNSRVLVLDPCNGEHLQSINLPDMGKIYDLCLYNDQVIMQHLFGDKCKISIYSMK